VQATLQLLGIFNLGLQNLLVFREEIKLLWLKMMLWFVVGSKAG
jgi:hypothetical protein